MNAERGQMRSHYRLVEKIGEGVMGVAWKAEDDRSPGAEGPRHPHHPGQLRDPQDSHTVADYPEATFTGYAAVTLPSTGWTVTPGATTVARADPITFTCNATTSESIYGYILKTTSSSGRICSERFDDGPYVVSLINDSIRVTPRIGLSGT